MKIHIVLLIALVVALLVNFFFKKYNKRPPDPPQNAVNHRFPFSCNKHCATTFRPPAMNSRVKLSPITQLAVR